MKIRWKFKIWLWEVSIYRRRSSLLSSLQIWVLLSGLRCHLAMDVSCRGGFVLIVSGVLVCAVAGWLVVMACIGYGFCLAKTRVWFLQWVVAVACIGCGFCLAKIFAICVLLVVLVFTLYSFCLAKSFAVGVLLVVLVFILYRKCR